LTAVSLALAVAFAAEAALPADRTPVRPRRRAAPRARFDEATNDTFLDDAFATLSGDRPEFAPAEGTRSAAAASPPTAAEAVPDGFRWSSLVSEETLTDEIKNRRADLAAAVAKSSDFKGGGYDSAREALSTVALAFGVIAAYDREIRWKSDAAVARDLFARAGANCKVGTDQSFTESNARLEDLESLIQGSSPRSGADRDDDFRWSQVAARPALMGRLAAADEAIAAATASRGDFDRSLDRLRHDAEMVAMIAEAIRQPDFEHHDDDTYRGYGAAMRDAAVRVREACGSRDYEAARAAADELKKSCDACHRDYRG